VTPAVPTGDLASLVDAVYDPLGWAVTATPEPVGAGYDAHRLEVRGMSVLYRSARVTPRKNGLFTAVWVRGEQGSTRPFDEHDGVDVVAIHVREAQLSGVFLLPLTVLLSRGVFSSERLPGRRGIRVYPPWTTPQSAQASTTQAWQCERFLGIDDGPGAGVDLDRARSLHLPH
jgi:hypothetical protein